MPEVSSSSKVKEGETQEELKTSPDLANLAEDQKFKIEAYQDIIHALIRVSMDSRFLGDDEELLLFGRDCIMESKAWARQERAKRPTKRAHEADSNDGDDGETLPLTMFYISDAGADAVDATPIETLLKDADVIWHSCKMSRMKPEEVKTHKLGLIVLNYSDPLGTFYEAGPPGQFWVWGITAFPEHESDFMEEVHLEVLSIVRPTAELRNQLGELMYHIHKIPRNFYDEDITTEYNDMQRSPPQNPTSSPFRSSHILIFRISHRVLPPLVYVHADDEDGHGHEEHEEEEEESKPDVACGVGNKTDDERP
ncbi:hypothetical protein FRB99_007815 [Tulasnella sp. 403]|nr:hypothetical protein FRB99_007815 [Tulasnella sp. 403]